MKTIVTYNEGEWFLEHSWYIDDFGLQRNSMEVWRMQNGIKTIYPLCPPIRISNMSLVGDNISRYENFEYSDMLRNEIEKLNSNKLI
jgi:hypothetical protein